MILRMIAAAVCACLLCVSSLKMLGAMQQGGYKNAAFFRWLKRKDNLQFNRLAVLGLCLILLSTVTALGFSFLDQKSALLLSSVPFFGLLLLYAWSDGKFALKVPLKRTGRALRLLAVYWLFTASVAYLLIAVLAFFADWNGSYLYGLMQYAPVGILPALTPFLLMAANALLSVFENLRNANFVKRARQVLDEQKIIRIGVVGSYGKTSLKNILNTLLSEKYTVVATPESFNTPVGIAKTVFAPNFADKQIFIAEMGARKTGDIGELCALVKPDYAVFTGICEQHIQSFGSIEAVWAEKSKILQCGAKKVVCGEEILCRAQAEGENVLAGCEVFDIEYGAAATVFKMSLYGEKVVVKTELLGKAAVENISLAAKLCVELGLTAEEIVKGIEKLTAIPHRLQLSENAGVYILDDGYNANHKSAEEAIEALKRFGGRRCIVTPGIVECGILEEKINGELGEKIAKAEFEKVILVGETLVGCVKRGYQNANGDMEKLFAVKSLSEAKAVLQDWLESGDAVLFLNDLPDVY